jgi:hypothetical protein
MRTVEEIESILITADRLSPAGRNAWEISIDYLDGKRARLWVDPARPEDKHDTLWWCFDSVRKQMESSGKVKA